MPRLDRASLPDSRPRQPRTSPAAEPSPRGFRAPAPAAIAPATGRSGPAPGGDGRHEGPAISTSRGLPVRAAPQAPGLYSGCRRRRGPPPAHSRSACRLGHGAIGRGGDAGVARRASDPPDERSPPARRPSGGRRAARSAAGLPRRAPPRIDCSSTTERDEARSTRSDRISPPRTVCRAVLPRRRTSSDRRCGSRALPAPAVP